MCGYISNLSVMSNAESRTVLVGGAVVTMDEDRRVIDPGAVVTADDRIERVGCRETVLEEFPNAERIDLEHTALLPGLIDTHGHAGHGLLKNLNEGDSFDWLETASDIYFQSSGTEFWRAEGYLAALEHLEFGVTTSLSFTGSQPRVDDPKFAAAAVEGYADLGLRHVVNVGPPGPPYPREYRDADTGEITDVSLEGALETTGEVIDGLHGTAGGRISAYVGPSSLLPEIERDGETKQPGLTNHVANPEEWSASEHSIDHLEGILELSERHDVPIHTHAYAGMVAPAAEAVPEILSSRLSLAHCAGMGPDELDIMADNGVSASHGPLTHAYAMDRFPVVEALDAGVNVAISTDGAGPDRSYDLLSSGRIAAQLQRVHFNDTSVMPAGKLLEMMTIDAATALDLQDEIGSLEPGKKADVIAIDLHSARARPRFALVPRIVHYASGLDTEFMMVDGTVLYEDRSFDAFDVDGILHDAEEAARAAIQRADREDALEPHPNTWGSSRYQ